MIVRNEDSQMIAYESKLSPSSKLMIDDLIPIVVR